MTAESWRTVTVESIADESPRSISIGPFGSSLKADMYSATGVPVIRGQNITDRRSPDTSDLVFVPREVAETFPACLVRDGDLVFPHRGAIGRVVLIGETEYLLSSSMMKLTCDRSRVDPQYLLYYFRGPGSRELLMRASSVGTPGIGQPLTSLRSVRVVLPPLDEQRAIAEVLGALDDKIAANTVVGERAMELAQHRFEHAAGGKSRVSLTSEAQPVLGGTPSRARTDFWLPGDRPWISAKDITGARFGVVIETTERISQLAVDSTKVKPLPRGSVILTARGTVGAVARLGEAMSFNQSCYGFAPTSLPPALLYFSVLSATEQAKVMSHGSVFDTITKRTLDQLLVPSFLRDERALIEAQLAPLLDSAEQCARESRQLATTRDALLPGLMSGKIRVKDAERVVEEAV